jgi:hypothetical protein
MNATANAPRTPRSGSANAAQLQTLIDTVDISGMVTGTPGKLALSAPHLMATSFLLPGSAAPGPQTLSAGQAALVQAAIAQANAAALGTVSAATGQPVQANTPLTTIQSIARGVTPLGATAIDIQQLEAGATATLHWWGWALQLEEGATAAMARLLASDLAGLSAVAAALAAISAPLAAVGSMVSAAGLNQWIAQVNRGYGVQLRSFLFVGVMVEGVYPGDEVRLGPHRVTALPRT